LHGGLLEEAYMDWLLGLKFQVIVTLPNLICHVIYMV